MSPGSTALQPRPDHPKIQKLLEFAKHKAAEIEVPEICARQTKRLGVFYPLLQKTVPFAFVLLQVDSLSFASYQGFLSLYLTGGPSSGVTEITNRRSSNPRPFSVVVDLLVRRVNMPSINSWSAMPFGELWNRL